MKHHKKKVKAIKKIRRNPLRRENLEKPKLTLKKVKKIVSNSSPLGIKTWRGIKFLCPECNSRRVKLIIRPEYLEDTTVFVNYECKSCGWGATSHNSMFVAHFAQTNAFGALHILKTLYSMH